MPCSSGKISPIAVAEPVVVGISEMLAARARRRSLCGASTMVCVLVMSWSVVIDAVPDADALVDHLHDGRQAVRRAGRGGQDVVHRRVVAVVVDADHDVERRRPSPALRRSPCARRARSTGASASGVRNRPVHSSTMSTPCSSHGTSAGSADALKPSAVPSIASVVPPRRDVRAPSGRGRSRTSSRWAAVAASPAISLTCDELEVGPVPRRRAARAGPCGRSR